MRVWTLLIVMVTAITVAGCAKKAPRSAAPAPSFDAVAPEAPLPSSPPPASTPEARASPPEVSRALTEDELFARKTLEELNAEMPLADVFFDYDSSTLRDEARTALQRNGEWLRRWSSTRVSIEGHCDSRGTSEYNLALGQRRADSVRDYLVSLGIAPDALVAVSKGEEAPFCREGSESEGSEACWQQNRRAHFIITAK